MYKEKNNSRFIRFTSMKKMLKYCDISESKKFSEYIINYWGLAYSHVKTIPPLHDLSVRKIYNL